MELIQGAWNGMAMLEAWAQASLEGNVEEERRLDAIIMARGSKKPRLTLHLGGRASRFDHLLQMIADARFEEARDELAAMRQDSDANAFTR